VLIVDDEEPAAEILAYVVADAGYLPVTATHGRRALELALEHWPALLITDLMMPYLSGADLIAALRAEAATRGVAPIPSVLITGAGHDAASAAGADVTLRKPFELEEVDALLRRFLPGSSR
jgi:DNA-binding response OmpR family regulator